MKAISRIQRVFQRKLFQISNINVVIRLNSCSVRPILNKESDKENSFKHWSYFQSLPAKTLQFNTKDQMNDVSLEKYMKTKYDDHHYEHEGHQHEEQLTLCHKTNTLNTLFDDVDILMLDNVLQKKIVNQCNNLQQEECDGIDSWMLFNYHDIDNQEYDANGVIICGLSTQCNAAYQIGPIILNKAHLL